VVAVENAPTSDVIDEESVEMDKDQSEDIEEMKQKSDEIEKEYSHLEGRLEKIEEEYSELKDKKDKIKQEKSELKDHNEQLEAKIKALEIMMSGTLDANNNPDETSAQYDTLSNTCAELEGEIRKLKLRVLVRDTEVERLKGYLEDVFKKTKKGKSGHRRTKRILYDEKKQHPGAMMLNNKRKSASMSNILDV